MEAPSMFVTLVSVHVVADRLDDFLDAIRVNHEASIREPGCVRFDVLRAPDDPSRFLLYEAYVDAAAAAAHKETPHYLAFRDQVAAWMAEPRVGVRWDGLYPELPAPAG
jgi:autoinducer 2-degrading protein